MALLTSVILIRWPITAKVMVLLMTAQFLFGSLLNFTKLNYLICP